MKKIISIIVVWCLLSVCLYVFGEKTEAISITNEFNSSIKQANPVTKKLNNQNILKSAENESKIIKGVPFVSQQKCSYSFYASPTMIFKFLGIDTNLEEVLFILGVGYSLAYSKGLLIPGNQISRDYTYISRLYGISHKKWISAGPEYSSDSVSWDMYWNKIKVNITNEIPVLTLTSLLPHNLKSNSIKNPRSVLKLVLPKAHAIVIVGFNESNQTICFNDPSNIINNEQYLGNYLWRDLADFKKGFFACRKKYPIPISTFEKIDEPLSKETRVNQSYYRNIERMNGNPLVYTEDWIYGNVSERTKEILGIKALEKYKEDIKPGLKSQILKLSNQKFKKLKNIKKISLKLNKFSNFNMIYADKNYTLHYLESHNNSLKNISLQIQFFKSELENWSKLNEHYLRFTKLGFFMRFIFRKKIINYTENIFGNIINIENKIIQNIS